jgi:opacity protein-like surface antigen
MKNSLLCSSLLLASLPGVQAQEIKWGFQLGAAFPTRSLPSDDSFPIALGAHAGIALGGGHVLRPRVDFVSMKNQKMISGQRGGSTTYEEKATLSSAELEYLFHFSGRVQGAYLIAGVGYQRVKLEYITNGMTSDGYPQSHGAIAYSAGAGWQFGEHFGVDLRYVGNSYSSPYPTYYDPHYVSTFHADTVRLEATFRF